MAPASVKEASLAAVAAPQREACRWFDVCGAALFRELCRMESFNMQIRHEQVGGGGGGREELTCTLVERLKEADGRSTSDGDGTRYPAATGATGLLTKRVLPARGGGRRPGVTGLNF